MIVKEASAQERGLRAQAQLLARQAQTAFDVVDAHAHLGVDAVMFIPEPDPQDVVAVMDRCGVRAAVISSLQAIRFDTATGNAETAAAVDRFPGRYLGAMVINPWQDPAAEISRWASDSRMVAIKLHPDVHEYPLSGPRYEPVWEFAAATGCPVLTHTWHGSQFDGWDTVDQVCSRHSDVRLIAGHTGVLPQGLDTAIELAGRHPHLFLELCGSMLRGRDIERLVREAGAGRVLYGSDAPFIDMRSSFGRLLFCDLDDADRDLVMGATTDRLTRWREFGRDAVRG